jgi:hypothetical protein
MKIESQVCGLELARRLKELGVEQDSDFYWCELAPNIVKPFCSLCREHRDFGSYERICSAFTVAEFGEMLPPAFSSSRGADGKWMCVNEMKSSSEDGKIIFADTEADARAKMLLYTLGKSSS